MNCDVTIYSRNVLTLFLLWSDWIHLFFSKVAEIAWNKKKTWSADNSLFCHLLLFLWLTFTWLLSFCWFYSFLLTPAVHFVITPSVTSSWLSFAARQLSDVFCLRMCRSVSSFHLLVSRLCSASLWKSKPQWNSNPDTLKASFFTPGISNSGPGGPLSCRF